MSFVISSLIPFPNIYWWCQVLEAEKLVFDTGERYQKMSYRNRYYIASANGLLMLSVPIASGRNNRSLVKDVEISYHEAWQRQQWRTLFSAYNRSPFFEYYAESLEALFSIPYQKLAEFNRATIDWCMKQLGAAIPILEKGAENSVVEQSCDLRQMKPGSESHVQGFPTYHQVFEERYGFLPNLSVLDLLFAEGPHARQWLKQHGPFVLKAIHQED